MYTGEKIWDYETGGIVISAPAIVDGKVYIGSKDYKVYCFASNLYPDTPVINGPTSGKVDNSYDYTFTSIDPEGDQVSYYIVWDDGKFTNWTDFQSSGEPYSESHTWTKKGTYTISAKAKDINDYVSDWGELQVTIPRNKAISNSFFSQFLVRFSNVLLGRII